jgi:hypothetical protein
MPIDWDMLARAFRVPMKSQTRDLTLLFARLAKWLAGRVKQAEQLERASRGFPIIRFRDEALTMRVHDEQKHACQEPPSFIESVKSSGRHFVDGIVHVKTAVDEANLLSNLVGSLADAVGAISASIDKFAVPRADLFDPSKKTAGDIFGIAALGFRVIVQSLEQIEGAAWDVSRVKLAYEALSTKKPGGPRLEAELGETLEELGRYMVGAMLLLPVLGEWIGMVLRAGRLMVEREVMKLFGAVEKAVYELRGEILSIFFTELPEFLRYAAYNLPILDDIVISNVDFLFKFVATYLSVLLNEVIKFTSELAVFMNYWIVWIADVLATIEKVADFNLTPFIAGFLGGVLGGLAGYFILPRFTIRDLVETGGVHFKLAIVAGLKAARAALKAGTVAGGPLMWWWDPTEGVREKLELVEEIAKKGLRRFDKIPMEVAETSPIAHMVDVSGTIKADAATLRADMATRRGTLVTQVENVFVAATDALTALQTRFDDEAAAAVRMGLPDGFWAIAAQAEAHAQDVFGEDLKKLRAKPTSDVMSQALEDWIIADGYKTLQRALPLYLEEMDRFWRERAGTHREQSALVMPTSAHILAKRKVRLARVQLKEMAIKVRSDEVDQDLADAIASRFQQEVTKAYLEGRKQLSGLHADERAKWEAEQIKLGKLKPPTPAKALPPPKSPTAPKKAAPKKGVPTPPGLPAPGAAPTGP